MSSEPHEIDEAFRREARLGLMVLTVLVAIFLYVAYGKLSGWNSPEPQAFQNQPEYNSSGDANAYDDAERPGALEGSNTPIQLQLETGGQARNPDPAIRHPATAASDSDKLNDIPVERAVWAPQPVQLARPGATPGQPDITPGARPLSPFVPSTNKARAAQQPSQPPVRPASKLDPIPATTRQQEEATGNEVKPPQKSDDPTASEPPQIPSRFSLPSLRKTNPQKGMPAKTARQEGKPPVRSASVRKSSGAVPRNSRNEPVAESAALPKSAGGSKSGIRPSATEPTAVPRTNEPSLALNQFKNASPLPETPAKAIVEEGEGFWLVAQRVYGDGRFFDALYQANKKRVKTFNDVPAGTELEIPPVSELRHRWPYLCPREEITTTGGETLFELASDHLGQASRYVELLKLNFARLPKGVTQNTPLPADVTLELPRYR